MLKILTLATALLGAAAPALAGVRMSGGLLAVNRNSSPSAGQLMAGGALVLDDTVGDFGVIASAGGSFQALGGLQRVQAQPGSAVSLTAVSKSTGTLDLVWSAPGLDGFLGSVVSGFYRLDYSSDPAHAFSPTTFLVEFATSVVPGQAQELHLAGLLPNTTYYAKVYLASPDKFFAEDGFRSGDSTLANVPTSPAVVSVGSTTVTLTYSVPGGAAEGYQADATSTTFAAGPIASSTTSNGTLQTLTIPNLQPNTTYFLRIGSLNWQGDRNYVLLLQVFTQVSGSPVPITFLISLPAPLSRRISFNWTNQPYVNPQGVLVLQSTSPTTTAVFNGAGPFAPGQVLGDGSVVKSTSSGASLQDGSLALDATYYYHFFSQGAGLQYSVDVATAIFLDLPPMAVANLNAVPSQDLTQITLTWDTVSSNLDGSAFKSTTTPAGYEANRYEITRSTTVLNANWVLVATVPLTATTFIDTVPDPSLVYLYRVRALDTFNTSDDAMAIDSNGDLYVFAADAVTHMRVPRRDRFELGKNYNSMGANIVLKAIDQPGDGSQNIFRSVLFQASRSPDASPVNFAFARGEEDFALRYDVSGGQVVVSSPAALSAVARTPVAAAAAAGNLGMYWNNGAKYIKLFGTVDTANQLVTVQGANTGPYQIRGLVREQSLNFDVSQLSNKVITPNGDGLNDKATFQLDNPHDSAFTGQVFDVQGRYVADMTPGVGRDTLQWDARGSNGQVVAGGVYIYQIRGEGRTFSGTLLVVK